MAVFKGFLRNIIQRDRALLLANSNAEYTNTAIQATSLGESKRSDIYNFSNSKTLSDDTLVLANVGGKCYAIGFSPYTSTKTQLEIT